MRINFFVAGLLTVMSVLCVSGQTPKVYKLEYPTVSAADPYTTLFVTVVLEKETVKKGPYARYAQKYLGAIAPLTDKSIYTLSGGSIRYIDPDSKPLSDFRDFDRVRELSNRNKPGLSTAFPEVNVDRTSFAEKSLEEQARDAAQTIFTIRNRRFDLVSGEAGEYVYGEGMQAALTEMSRMESEYLALFMGKRSVEREVRTFEIVPQSDKTTYIVCRYSADNGFVPESDLSGTPIVLTLEPEGLVKSTDADKKSRSGDSYRVADYVTCILSGSEGEISRSRIPIYQYGATLSGISSSAK